MCSIFRSLAFGALIAVSLANAALSKDGPIAVDAELVFAVDVSYSMDQEEQRLQRAGYVSALSSPEFLHALGSGPLGKVAVAYMEWASYNDQRIVLDWTLIDGPESARIAADRLSEASLRRAHRTSIAGAIDASMKMFEGNGFSGTRRVIDVSGDGPNNDGRPVTTARDEALRSGVTINGLPLVDIRPYIGFADIKELDIYYEDCVIGGPGAFMIPVNSTAKFIEATRTKLVLEIARSILPDDVQAIHPVAAREPRISCTIGESMWRQRMGN